MMAPYRFISTHKLDKRLKVVLSLALIILVGLVSNYWVLSQNNFYYADDWGWFLYSKHHDLLSYLRIFPLQMYNDRPVGQLFLKLLFDTFSYNYIAQHTVLLCVHLLNGIMVFFLARSLQLFKRKTLGPLLAAIIFVSWQGANFAVQWSAAAFDLLSIFFVTVFLISFIEYIKANKGAYLFISCLAYFLALRTKESNLFLPFVAIALALLVYKKNLKWLQKTIPLLVIWLIYTAILIFLAINTNFQGLNNVAAYKSSFSPLFLIRNIFRYALLYFDITNVYQTYQRNFLLTGIIGLIGTAYAYFLYSRRRRDIPIVTFLVVSVILCLLPVLPLVYSQLRLYLYVPSVFLSLLLAFISFQISKYHYLNLLIWLAFVIYINIFNRGTLETRNLWLNTGYENRIAFENTVKLNIPVKTRRFTIVNDKKPTDIFQFGRGDVLRLLLNNKNIDVHIFSNVGVKEKDTYLIDYSKIKPYVNVKKQDLIYRTIN